jgi:hypothetical protein
MRSILVFCLMLCACQRHEWTNAFYNPDGDVDQAKAECRYEAQRQMAMDNHDYGWSKGVIETNVFRACMRAKGFR